MKPKQQSSKANTNPTLATTPCLQSKQPLWRQFQPDNNFAQEGFTRSGQILAQDESEITPVRKKKQKSETISNFLKHLQVQVDDKDEKHENQSQIVSILDVKYTDSFYTNKRNLTCKSILADSKFHIFLLISSVKQFHTSLKDVLITHLQFHQHQLEVLAQNTKKIMAKYESELNEKSMQVKNLQLQLREQRLTNVQQKYRIESQLRQSEQRSKHLDQKLLQAQRKIKEEQQVAKNEKNYNKELNELILKFHKKVEQLENKCMVLKQEHDYSLEVEVNRLTKKYQQLFQEQTQNYELKLENNRIKYENFIQNSMGSTYLDFSKVQEGSVDMTKSATSKLEDLIWSTDRAGTEVCVPDQKATNLVKKRQIINQRMLQNTSSPKSNTSGRRFARTTKHSPLDQFNRIGEKMETASKQTVTPGTTPYMHASLNQKLFLSEDKSPRNADNSDSRNTAVQRQKILKSHLQNSQPDLQFERVHKVKHEQHRSPNTLYGSPQKKNLISIQIQMNKLLNDPGSDNSKFSAKKSHIRRGPTDTKVEEGELEQISPNFSQPTGGDLLNKIGNQYEAQNFGNIISTFKSNSNGNNNKNIVYIDKKLRETIA